MDRGRNGAQAKCRLGEITKGGEMQTATATKPSVTGYEWRSYFDDEQEKRVSDWSDFELCEECGRKIVHLYFLSDGRIVGRECAAILCSPLSLAKGDRLRKKALDDALREQAEAANARYWSEQIQETIKRHLQPTPEKAWSAYLLHNYNTVARWGKKGLILVKIGDQYAYTIFRNKPEVAKLGGTVVNEWTTDEI